MASSLAVEFDAMFQNVDMSGGKVLQHLECFDQIL